MSWKKLQTRSDRDRCCSHSEPLRGVILVVPTSLTAGWWGRSTQGCSAPQTPPLILEHPGPNPDLESCSEIKQPLCPSKAKLSAPESQHILTHLQIFCVQKVVSTNMQLRLETMFPWLLQPASFSPRDFFSCCWRICHMSVKTAEGDPGYLHREFRIRDRKCREAVNVLPERISLEMRTDAARALVPSALL